MIIKYLLFSTLNLVFFLGFYVLLLRRDKYFFFNRIYLLLTLVIGIFFPIFSIVGRFSFRNGIVTNPDFIYNLPEIIISNINHISSTNTGALNLIWLIYLGGIIVMFFRLISSIRDIYNIYKTGRKIEFQGYKNISFRESKISFSFFNFIFIKEGNDEVIEKIIRHELVHVRHGHSYDIVFLEILKIIFWFNPLIFLYEYMLKENHEYTADNDVINEFSRKDYSEILINQLQSGMQLRTTNNFINSLIKKRIKMMYREKKNIVWKYALIIPVILLVLIFSTDVYSQTEKVTYEGNVYEKVDEMPRFPGCENQESIEDKEQCAIRTLMLYIATNLKYPEEAMRNYTEGKVFIKFVVTKEGTIADIEVLKGLENGCSEAAIAVVENMNNFINKWTPGKLNGEYVNVSMTLPFMFKLKNEEKK